MDTIKHAAKLTFVFWIARLAGSLFPFLLLAALLEACREAM
jgi:hypothetical protein